MLSTKLSRTTNSFTPKIAFSISPLYLPYNSHDVRPENLVFHLLMRRNSVLVTRVNRTDTNDVFVCLLCAGFGSTRQARSSERVCNDSYRLRGHSSYCTNNCDTTVVMSLPAKLAGIQQRRPNERQQRAHMKRTWTLTRAWRVQSPITSLTCTHSC